jgi:hypothetical protein
MRNFTCAECFLLPPPSKPLQQMSEVGAIINLCFAEEEAA